MIVNGEIFCYWDFQTRIDTTLKMFNLLLAFVLFLNTVRVYMKARKVLNSGILKFYFLLMAWGVGKLLTMNLFGILTYELQYLPNADKLFSYQMNEIVTKNSEIYQLVDTIPGFIIQTLLLLISLQIIGNMLHYNPNKTGKVIYFYQIGRKYLWIRFLILLLPIVLMFFQNIQLADHLSQIKIGLMTFDALICFIFLFYTRFYHLKDYQPLNFKQEFVQPLKRQLAFLIFIAICRIFINITIYLVMPNMAYFIQHNKFCFNNVWNPTSFTFIYIILGDYFMHFLPVFVITKMYSPPS